MCTYFIVVGRDNDGEIKNLMNWNIINFIIRDTLVTQNVLVFRGWNDALEYIK